MPLPQDTKYKVTDALVAMTRMYMVDSLQGVGVDMDRMDITRIDRLNFTIRIRSTDGSGPKHIAVKVSEPW
jgi:hypothetical protein